MNTQHTRRGFTQTRNKAVIKHRVIPNLIWNLQRLSFPICLHKNMRGRSRIKYGMTFLYNGGFTLIELLVVVLIIGILAAVAVPQYQKAVEKSRITEAKINLKALVNAAEIYALSNTGTTWNLQALGIEISGTYNEDRTELITPTFTYYMDECLGESQNTCVFNVDRRTGEYGIGLGASLYDETKPGKFFCWGLNDNPNTICSKYGATLAEDGKYYFE